MSWHNINWSLSEKKIARAAYDIAVAAALAGIMAEFKRRAEAATEPSDMWDIETYLRDERREIDEMFIYSYSKLPNVFGYAISKGYLTESQLSGLAQDKLFPIQRMVSFFSN